MDLPVGYVGKRGLHFNVTDKLFDVYLFHESHERYKDNPRYSTNTAEESFRTLLEEMLDAQVALANLAPKLVAALHMDVVQ